MISAYIIFVLARVTEIYSVLLALYALLSWFPNAYDTFLGRLLRDIVEPVLKPFERLNLQFAGLDFTIIFVIIVLNGLTRLLMMLLV
ncbi:YggT family protein [Streptococcus macacae]|uniref:YGGT family protein n=1 Tax=Streptococcus macacae NCTC 11558 TaxID=764298 RepID=G5JVZ3_9STRE|nr:YggT family protein [Streptococcus macacae]EHJ52954.1 YGGT family protein [Streptococcus macacae NCTC 11558]SUN78985.1 YggT family protein [Streptococcus macacae NCTC 11558]